jgi:hypothetical protein
MYREEDIVKIEENYDRIRNEASKEYKTYYEPTLVDISKVYNAIKNFIKKNKKIVYGGFAQNMLIKMKNKNDVFYTEINGAFYNLPDIADIEFYSSTPIDDIIQLTEDLHAQGFKHVEGKAGMHGETYKVFVNFDNYCDISYMSQNIFNNLPTIEIDGIKCAHPHFMLCDAYRILTDPMTSYWRIDKSIKRFQKILKYYPIEDKTTGKIEIKTSNNDNILRFIRKKIIQMSKLIVVGIYSYNYYAKKMSKNLAINVPYYELISSEFEKDGKYIYKHLIHKFGRKITTKEFYPFCEFLDKRIEYYYEGKLVLKLYRNNNRCIVYNFSDKKKTHFGTYNLVMMYLFFEYYYNIINRNSQQSDLIKKIIGNFYKLRNDYLNRKKITVIDISPFRDFTFKCYGRPLDVKRTALIEGLELFKQGKRKFKYIPSGKISKTPDYSFLNSSGNQILNEKYLICKKNNI